MPRQHGATSKWQRWCGAAVAGLLLLALLVSQLACGGAPHTPAPPAQVALPWPSATATVSAPAAAPASATPAAPPSTAGTSCPGTTPTAPAPTAVAPSPTIAAPKPLTLCPDLPGRFEVLGLAGGLSWAVAVQGRYACLSAGPRLVVLDLAQPAQPKLVGQVVTGLAPITRLAVAGDYAYALDMGGQLHVVALAGPAAPREVGHYNTLGYGQSLALDGCTLYLGNDDGLYILDVADPAHPALAGFFDTPGRLERLVVRDGLALLSGGDYVNYPYRDLRIVDVADPAHPRELALYARQPSGSYPLVPVAVRGRYAWIVAQGNELRGLDLADPAHPVQVSSYTLGRLVEVAPAGAARLLAAGGGTLATLDLSDPAQPREVARAALPSPGTLVAAEGDLAFTLERPPAGAAPAGDALLAALHVVGLANPQAPTDLGRFELRVPMGWPQDGQVYRLAPAGSRFYVAADMAGLQILDLADPAAPQLLGSGGAPGFFYDVALLQGAEWAGRTYALVADGSWGPAARAGLRVFDVTDPARIVQVGDYDSPGNALALAVAGHIAYLADGEKGLRVIDVADPAHPVEVGAFEAPGFARGVAVVGRYACVADDKQGLRIVDIADPAQPRQVALYAPDGRGALSVAAAGELIYLPTFQGVTILRLNAAGQPQVVGQVALQDASLVAVGDGLACVADWWGLYAFDVADPAQPKPLACLDGRSTGSVQAMTIADGKVYVATSLSGLFVLRVGRLSMD